MVNLGGGDCIVYFSSLLSTFWCGTELGYISPFLLFYSILPLLASSRFSISAQWLSLGLWVHLYGACLFLPMLV